jgi:hypothetical protein
MNYSIQNQNPVSQKHIHIYQEYLKDPKFKTEMCKNWERTHSCPYYNKCRFAHGREELMIKESNNNPNHKAKDCLNFFKYGYCSYGRRCCFKHDERKMNETTINKDFLVLLNIFNPEGKTRLSIFNDLTETRANTDKSQQEITEIEIFETLSKKSQSNYSSSTSSTAFTTKFETEVKDDDTLNSTKEDISNSNLDEDTFEENFEFEINQNICDLCDF